MIKVEVSDGILPSKLDFVHATEIEEGSLFSNVYRELFLRLEDGCVQFFDGKIAPFIEEEMNSQSDYWQWFEKCFPVPGNVTIKVER